MGENPRVMWYLHQIISGPFVVGIAGNVAAAVIGLVTGLLVAHKLYDLRKIHRAIREYTGKHRSGLLANETERERP
jgi:hypothetical protein